MNYETPSMFICYFDVDVECTLASLNNGNNGNQGNEGNESVEYWNL